MVEELKNKIKIIADYFKDFDSFIELHDFRTYLLFTLTSQVPTNVLAQLGIGGSRNVITIPYNPAHNIYYQKINLMTSGSMIIYVKREALKSELVIEKDDPLFKDFLNSNELSLAFRGKEKILFPEISDVSNFDLGGDSSPLTIEVDDLFYTLESFIAVLEPNILFVLDRDGSEPDLIFTFNMMPQLPGQLNKNVLKIDVFLDQAHKTKGITYVKREENYTLKYMKDIKEISHADLYNSAFSVVIHIKSFHKPY
jgi:hypothetical protein